MSDNNIKAFKHMVDRRDVYRKAARRSRWLLFAAVLLLMSLLAATVAMVVCRVTTGEDIYGEVAAFTGIFGGGIVSMLIAYAAEAWESWTFRRDEIDARIRKYEL